MGGPPTPPEIRTAVAAAASVARENQVVSQVASTPAEDWGAPDVPDDFDHESAFTAEVVNIQNTSTHLCDVCFNVDVITGPTQLQEANMTYMTKAQAIQNLHYCVGHIAPERLQHLVENGQWSWTHASKPVNFVRELPPCPYYALAKAKRSSFTKPIAIPDQIGGLFFVDVQGPFEVESLEVYKIGIIEAKTRFFRMTMASSKKVDGVLDQWLKDNIPWMRAQHGLKGFKFQTDKESSTVRHARTW